MATDISVVINPPNQTNVTIGEGIPKHAETHAPGASDSLASYYVTGNVVRPSETGLFVTTNQTGQFVNTGSTGSFVTGSVVRPSETGNFLTTGQTGYYSGVFYPYSSNPNGYVQGAVVRPSNTGAFLDTGSSQTINSLKNFLIRPTVNGTGVLLSGEASVTGALTGVFYPLNSNPSGYITGVNLSNYVTKSSTGDFVTTGQTGSFITTSQTGQFVGDSETGAFYPASNPSGFITGVDLSNYVTGSVVRPSETGAFLTTGAGDNRYALQSNTGNFVTGSVVRPSETGSFITTNQTGQFVSTGSTGSFITTNQTGEFVWTGATGNFATNDKIVFLTGNQTISGIKEFASRPTVNGTGVLLSGEAAGAANTGSLTGVFYPLNSNPSGYITGVDLSNYVTQSSTGSFVTTGQTGSFIVSSQTGQFVSTGATGDFITSSQTGQFVWTGSTGNFVTGSVVRPSETGSFITTGQTGQFVSTGATGIFLTSGSPVEIVHLYAKNDETFVLNKGQPVYIGGANGSNPLIKMASNTGEFSSSKTIGLLAQTLNPNDFGYVITEGALEGFDTSAAVAGDPMWLGPTGQILYGTGNKPYGLNNLVYLGVVLRAQSVNGKVYVQIQNGFEIEELHNVYANNPLNKDSLFYDSGSGAWFARQINTGDVSGISAYALAANTGSFITTAQTGQFVWTGATGSFVVSSQTGAFLTTGAADGRYYTLSDGQSISGYAITGFNDAITGMTITGDTTKVITLFQRDGTTVTGSFTDNAGTGGGGGSGASVTISTSPPVSPTAGSLWFNSESGVLYIYYDDGDSQQWVAPDNNGIGLNPITLDASISGIFSVSGQQISGVDPNADRILFWDDSESKLAHLTVGSGLTLNGTTLSATGAGGASDTPISLISSIWS